jgi:hypothetical protein
MNRVWIRSAVAALAVAAIAGPAFAHTPAPPGGGCRVIRGAATPDPADDVQACRQDVFFHQAEAPIGNLAATGRAGLPSWDTTKPEGELAEGGAYVSSSELDIFAAEGSPAARAQFVGTFTGPIDTLGFRMYARSPFDEVNGSSLGATVYLEIDGEVIHDNYDTAAIDLPLVDTGENTVRIDGVFHKLYAYMESVGMDMSPTKEHTVKFGLVGWFFPGSETVFLYDADEAQAGLFFNLEPTSMAGFTKIEPVI